MKRLILVICILLGAIQSNATNIPLDSIKSKMVSFYKELDPQGYKNVTADYFSDFLIYDRKQGAIEEGKEGVFDFKIFSSNERTHVILVEKDGVEILNMTDPIDQNVLKLLQFLERNEQYGREDILFYTRDLILTYQRNEKDIASFKGLIR